jgi:hypothetical protein
LSSEIALINDNTRPDTSEQFVFGDDLAGTLNQDDQEVECTNADANGCITLEQEMRRGPQTKRPKADRAIMRHGDVIDSQRSAPPSRLERRV